MQFDSVPFLKLTPVRPEVRANINDVLEKGIFMNGSYTEIFRNDFSTFMGMENVILTANCTDALEIILRTLDVSKSKEVITSSFSWFSDASVIELVGAKPVLCDINLEHFGLDVQRLEASISSMTKAVIVPHLFGCVHPEIKQIAALCSERGVVLIEDCAQAHGATLDGRLAGTFGDVAAFSFYPTKNLAALGDAGAIVTNNGSLAYNFALWSSHGQTARNEHKQIGRNSRMDELQAAILTANLPFLSVDNEKRRKLAAIYYEELKNAPCTLPFYSEGNVFHQYVISSDRRDELKKYLGMHRIETDIHYPTALSDMPFFKTLQSLPNATLASNTVLSLPIHPNHSEDEIKFVAKKVKQFFTI